MFGSPDLSLYNKANDPFFNSLRKSDVEAQVKFTSKAMEMARVTSPRGGSKGRVQGVRTPPPLQKKLGGLLVLK